MIFAVLVIVVTWMNLPTHHRLQGSCIDEVMTSHHSALSSAKKRDDAEQDQKIFAHFILIKSKAGPGFKTNEAKSVALSLREALHPPKWVFQLASSQENRFSMNESCLVSNINWNWLVITQRHASSSLSIRGNAQRL